MKSNSSNERSRPCATPANDRALRVTTTKPSFYKGGSLPPDRVSIRTKLCTCQDHSNFQHACDFDAPSHNFLTSVPAPVPCPSFVWRPNRYGDHVGRDPPTFSRTVAAARLARCLQHFLCLLLEQMFQSENGPTLQRASRATKTAELAANRAEPAMKAKSACGIVCLTGHIRPIIRLIIRLIRGNQDLAFAHHHGARGGQD